ncbi:hypothetical protein J6590_017268 [Homalodisca vitripennis]|nr:hypothetical protein J6590_017268 [Homalodisca vitripennis]
MIQFIKWSNSTYTLGLVLRSTKLGCWNGVHRSRRSRAKKPSLTLINLGTNGLKVTSEPPLMAGRADACEDRIAQRSRSNHARLCLTWLSRDNHRILWRRKGGRATPDVTFFGMTLTRSLNFKNNVQTNKK